MVFFPAHKKMADEVGQNEVLSDELSA